MLLIKKIYKHFQALTDIQFATDSDIFQGTEYFISVRCIDDCIVDFEDWRIQKHTSWNRNVTKLGREAYNSKLSDGSNTVTLLTTNSETVVYIESSETMNAHIK